MCVFIYSVIKKCYLQGNWWENGTPGIQGNKHAVFTQQSLTETRDSGRGEQRERRNTLEIKDTTTRVNMVRRAFTHELYNLGRKPERTGRPQQNFPFPRERLYWICKTVNQLFLNSVLCILFCYFKILPLTFALLKIIIRNSETNTELNKNITKAKHFQTIKT